MEHMLKMNRRFNHLQDALSSVCSAPLNFTFESIIIAICCVLGLIWAIYNMTLVLKINVK